MARRHLIPSYEEKRDQEFQTKIPDKYRNLPGYDQVDPKTANDVLDHFGEKFPEVYSRMYRNNDMPKEKYNRVLGNYAYNVAKEKMKKEKEDYDKEYEKQHPRFSTRVSNTANHAKDLLKKKPGMKAAMEAVIESANDGIISREEVIYLMNALR